MFPACQHPSPFKKECSEPIKWKCRQTSYDRHPVCGHEVQRKCWQRPIEVVCQHRPCPKNDRDCGHLCVNVCGEDCNVGKCVGSEEAAKKELAIFRHRAELKVRELERRCKLETTTFVKVELLKTGSTSSEFNDVADKVGGLPFMFCQNRVFLAV